ncbi:hypothetical protein DXG01_011729 [Tephrocybe rancida]|nr:hypothetical protein DXG01_011729 [Tephrocybe rancida]
MYATFPHGTLIESPDIFNESDPSLVLPAGPPQDPSSPLVPDEQVFATHHRISDFDLVTVVRDLARTLQLFRWRKHIRQVSSKLVAHPRDVLCAATNKDGLLVHPALRPIYPYDASELPVETVAHLQATQRQSPLVNAGVSDQLKRSGEFSLEILDVIAEGSNFGICTVYRCRITSIDNHPVSSSPSLCLKLFDDRFQAWPNEDDPESDPRWFDHILLAETLAFTEAMVYDKLHPVQGTVIPWFYGTHSFTLPNGTVLYGLLMEYIEGKTVSLENLQALSTESQIQIIQSCRHAARVLDVSDVNQRDWHSGQILFYTNPTTLLTNAVMIDFALTTQTYEVDKPNHIKNYLGIYTVLEPSFGEELVLEHYGDPDDWDPVSTTLSSMDSRRLEARDMFQFISVDS